MAKGGWNLDGGGFVRCVGMGVFGRERKELSVWVHVWEVVAMVGPRGSCHLIASCLE